MIQVGQEIYVLEQEFMVLSINDESVELVDQFGGTTEIPVEIVLESIAQSTKQVILPNKDGLTPKDYVDSPWKVPASNKWPNPEFIQQAISKISNDMSNVKSTVKDQEVNGLKQKISQLELQTSVNKALEFEIKTYKKEIQELENFKELAGREIVSTREEVEALKMFIESQQHLTSQSPVKESSIDSRKEDRLRSLEEDVLNF